MPEVTPNHSIGHSGPEAAPFVSGPGEMALYGHPPLPSWRTGIEVAERPLTPASSAPVQALVLGMVVVVCLNIRPLRRLLRQLPVSLWSVRRRQNIFDQHTANETRTIALLMLQLCVFAGVFALLAFGPSQWGGLAWGTPPVGWASFGWWNVEFAGPAQLMLAQGGLFAVYYLFQLVVYGMVGFVFAPPGGSHLWMRGLNASLAVTSMALAPLALLAVLHPHWDPGALWLAAGVYVVSRLIFILKGFRIFYARAASLLYFILYLCALEIAPLLVLWQLAVSLCPTN